MAPGQTSNASTTSAAIASNGDLLHVTLAAAQHFLAGSVLWDRGAHRVLAQIGEAVAAHRVSIVEEERSTPIGSIYHRRCAWVSATPAYRIGAAEATLLYRGLRAPAVVAALDAGEVATVTLAELAPDERPAETDWASWATLVVPIMVAGRRWGAIACEHWTGGREWSQAERDALRGVATIVGAALQQHRTAAALNVSEERNSLVARATHDVIWDTNLITNELVWSGAIETMFGYSTSEVKGVTWWDERVHPDDYPRVWESLSHVLQGGGDVWSDEYRFRCGDQSYATVIDRGYVLRDALGRPIRMIGSMMDITARKALEEQLAFQASHDTLTAMPNRSLFTDRLTQALARANRRGSAVAVLFLDLDRFKVINDSLGHVAGDELLQATASRIRTCLRAEDTAARFGGDEFTALLEEISSPAIAIAIAERINEALQEPFLLAGHELVVTTSIGIAISSPRDTPATLLRNADIAMYRAKANGKACYELFDPAMNERALERLKLEAALRHALQRDELRVYYQPKINLATGALVGLEALVRWVHPQRGLVPPSDFIPLAEETGLIIPLEQWVLAEACRQGRRWLDAIPSAPPFCLSVNVSVSRFRHRNLVADIAATLAETGFPAPSLILEITESVVMDHAQENIATLRELKQLGVQIAIDDFGTGYSSLSYLKRFPVDLLKIDRAFVARLGQVAEDTAIVQAIVSLAHTLDLQVVAEGIETEAQLAQLQALGCEFGQGYMVARPVSPEEAAAYLRPGASPPRDTSAAVPLPQL